MGDRGGGVTDGMQRRQTGPGYPCTVVLPASQVVVNPTRRITPSIGTEVTARSQHATSMRGTGESGYASPETMAPSSGRAITAGAYRAAGRTRTSTRLALSRGIVTVRLGHEDQGGGDDSLLPAIRWCPKRGARQTAVIFAEIVRGVQPVAAGARGRPSRPLHLPRDIPIISQAPGDTIRG